MISLAFEEAAMNDKTGGNRGPRRAAALILVAALAVLATACGGSSDPSSAGPPTAAQVLALAQCMRTHGVRNFPDPNASGGYSLASNGSLEGAGGTSIDINSSQVETAYGDCRHLLPGGPSFSRLGQIEQQEQQRQDQMLPLMVKYVQCMRSHGVPNFPSPGENSQGQKNVSPINVNSPQFLAAAKACQHLLPPGAHVSISQSTHRSTS
jgi:hypothetical protein